MPWKLLIDKCQNSNMGVSKSDAVEMTITSHVLGQLLHILLLLGKKKP